MRASEEVIEKVKELTDGEWFTIGFNESLMNGNWGAMGICFFPS